MSQISIDNGSTDKIKISLKSSDPLQVSLNGVSTSHIAVGSSSDPLQVSLRDINTSRVTIDSPAHITIADYNTLMNLPSLNGVTIRGHLLSSDLYLSKESINTKEYWAEHYSYIPDYGEIIIYSNISERGGINYPGLKIGDGINEVGDLSFIISDSVVSYQALSDKPKINNVTLTGQNTMTEILASGLIIDGGSSQGVDV